MPTTIKLISDYIAFIDALKQPAPDIAYLLMPKEFRQIKPFTTLYLHQVVYTDVISNGIPSLYPSCSIDLLQSNILINSPLLVHTQHPLQIPYTVVYDKFPLNNILKSMLQFIKGYHIPDTLFEWTVNAI